MSVDQPLHPVTLTQMSPNMMGIHPTYVGDEDQLGWAPATESYCGITPVSCLDMPLCA